MCYVFLEQLLLNMFLKDPSYIKGNDPTQLFGVGFPANSYIELVMSGFHAYQGVKNYTF